MLSVLLVDDEPFILQGMQLLVDWESEGFCIEGVAGNGLEALEILRKKRLDLIIADIVMPGMDGIKLFQTIREQALSDATLVILSGYFEYAHVKSAMEINCFDYLLKPVQKEDLLQLLRRTTEVIRRQTQRSREIREGKQAFGEKQWLSLLSGKFGEENLKTARLYCPDATEFSYMQLESDAANRRSAALNAEEMYDVQERLYEVCAGFLCGDTRMLVPNAVSTPDACGVGLIVTNTMTNAFGTVKSFCEALLGHVRRHMAFPARIYAGGYVETLAELNRSYKEVVILRSLALFRGEDDQGVSIYEIENSRPDKGTLIEKKVLDELIDAVSLNDDALMARKSREIYLTLSWENVDVPMIQMGMNYLLYGLIHLARKQSDDVDQNEMLRYFRDGVLSPQFVLSDENSLLAFVREFADYLAQLRRNNAETLLDSVRREVREHYRENITLKSLGTQLFVNPVYLGRLFKRQYEQSFKDYLNQYRIERAVQELAETDHKVYVIAEEVGYHDLNYFISRFTALKGMTPFQYRKQFHDEI